VTNVDRRRAHLHVGAVTVGVFLVLLLVGAAHRGADSSSSSTVAPSSNAVPTQPQVTPGPPDGELPPDRQGPPDRGFPPDRDGDF